MGQQWILLVILTLYEAGFTTETENGEKINELPSNVRNQKGLYITKGAATVTPKRTRDCSKKPAAFLCRKQENSYGQGCHEDTMCGKSLSCVPYGRTRHCLCVDEHYWDRSQQQCQRESMFSAKFFDTAMTYTDAAEICNQNDAYLADEVIFKKTLKKCVNTKLPILLTAVPHNDNGIRCVTVQLVDGDIQQNSRVNCSHKFPFFCIRTASAVSSDLCNNWDKQVQITKETIDIKLLIGVVTAVVLTAAVAVAAMTVYFRKLRQKRVRIQIETPPEEACSNEDEDRYEIPYPANHEYIELSSGKDYDEMSSYERLQDPDTSENPYRQINSGEEVAQGPPLLGHYESLDIGTRSDNSMYTSLT